jgi:hypothetical protein
MAGQNIEVQDTPTASHAITTLKMTAMILILPLS